MARYLNKAPLVHVVIHLKYSQIPELTNPSNLINTSVHKEMVAIGFQEFIESKAETVSFNLTDSKVSSSDNTFRYVFRASGQRECVILSDQSLMLKTTNYTGFDDFRNKFGEILAGLNKAIPHLKTAILKSIGFRYSNLIVPGKNETLNDYLVDGTLPKNKILDTFGNKKNSVSQINALTNENQILRLFIEEILTQDNKVTKLLHENLIEPDPKAGLLIKNSDSWSNLSVSHYALLDIDHIYEFQASPLFDDKEIITRLSGLHTIGANTFWEMVTVNAKSKWNETTK